MKTPIQMILVTIVLGFALIGCGPAMHSMAGRAPGAVDLETEYQISSMTVEAAKAGNPLGIGDVSDLSDDEVIAKLIEFLKASADRIQEQLRQAQASGRTFPEALVNAIESLDERNEELFARLQSDQAFRAATIERLRSGPILPDGERNPTPPPFVLTGAICDQIAKQLASGKLPEFAQTQLQAHYDRDCK